MKLHYNMKRRFLIKAAAVIFMAVVGFLIAIFAQFYPVQNDDKPAQTLDGTLPPTSALENEFSYDDLPAYNGTPYIVLNNNIPYFIQNMTQEELKQYETASFETYGELDDLGRCTTCTANIGKDLMPTDDREPISSIKPTGWQSQSGENPPVYNRCHLIGFQLTGENANRQNLVTGTRALNVDAMLPYENIVADYVKETGNHVLYRVTPVFIGDELVCRGILMEGFSIEDSGKAISFCIWCYNNQEHISIDYATGEYIHLN